MIITKLYKYNSSQEANGYRGEDFSKYILLGDSDTDDLTEVLDTVELTLAGLPFSEEFAPKTKFIYEKWEEVKNDDGTVSLEMWKDWHLCVSEDIVSQPIISDNTYFNHTISFVEASAIAQGRLVDNIAVTYKLKDVTLDGKVAIDENAKAAVNIQNVEWTPSEKFGYSNILIKMSSRTGKQFFWRFPTWFDSSSPYYGQQTDWTDFDYYQAVDPNIGYKEISLPVPMLEVQTGRQNTKSFYKVGYCSVNVVVEETNRNTNEKRIVLDFQTNPASSVAEENAWTEDEGWGVYANAVKPFVINRYTAFSESVSATQLVSAWKQVAVFDQSPSNRKITFNALPNCVYTIKVYLKNFESPDYNGQLAIFYDYSKSVIYKSLNKRSGFGIWFGSESNYEVNNDYPTATLSFMTYSAGTDTRLWLRSAPMENAYSLYQKAQINTQNVVKQEGVPITETPQAYYVGEDDKLELSNTKVVENFYNQKNWWELQLEIGKYIHAIPKIRFGSDDRFITTWQKLGLPEQYQDVSNKISIYNSRSIENYISACSSYVSNMVQLGGVIDEWVAPKSSSEDYLVYNDVAEIITNKNIIEIVDMEVKCINSNSYGITVGETRNLTGKGTQGENINGYVFEENVYSLLDIDAKSLTNKGLAIYYELGSNIIKGLNYRLPTVNTGTADNEYAIKRIIGHAFGVLPVEDWANIKVNDFIFHIIYHTKDTVRTDQTRPDLRKYLLSSKYDRVPQHNQFNNQQDIVVDSVKFGNNIYGKLIRTGNTSFTVTEWVTSLNQIKQAGQLYTIRGNIYYVAKVQNTYFSDHVISVVEYSKDYNQLSEIIGIPSEPRFYEISEQSLIKREVAIDDYLLLTTSVDSFKSEDPFNSSFVKENGLYYLGNLLFSRETEHNPSHQAVTYPKYAITVFKNDEDRKYGDVLGNENFYKDVCHPINTYSIENTLTMEWDMVDNFSAGDAVSKPNQEVSSSVDTAYNTLTPVQYTDAFGRSDLMDFIIMENFESDYGQYGVPSGLSAKQIQDLPNCPVLTIARPYPQYKIYVGTLETNHMPTATELTDFVQTTKGRDPQISDGIVVIVTTTVDNVTTKTNYLTVYYNEYPYIPEWQPLVEIDNAKDYEKYHIIGYQNALLFSNQQMFDLGTNTRGLGLLKDNREQISVNYNVQMLTDSDRFVLSSYLWEPNKSEIKLALLSEEINKISNDTIPDSIIINPHDVMPETIITYYHNLIPFKHGYTTNHTIVVSIENALEYMDLSTVKAIAIVSDIQTNDTLASGSKYFVMGRNITGLSQEEAKKNWEICIPDKVKLFPHQ